MAEHTVQNDEIVVLIGNGDVHAIVLTEQPTVGMELKLRGAAGIQRGCYRVHSVNLKKAPGGREYPAIEIFRSGDLPLNAEGQTIYYTSI